MEKMKQATRRVAPRPTPQPPSKSVIIVEFTPFQLKFWICVLVALLAGSFALGMAVSRLGRPGPAPVMETEAHAQDPPVSPNETDDPRTGAALDVARLHPPFCKAHDAPIAAIALSPDGALLATTSWDSTVKVWAVDSGEKLRQCPLDNMVWHALALSPDGRVAAFAEPFKMMEAFGIHPGISLIHLWDLEQGTQVFELDKEYAAFAFSPDGHLFALLDENNVWLYDAHNWEIAEFFPIRDDSDFPFTFAALGFSADSQELTVLDAGRRVTVVLADGRRTVIHNDNPPTALTHAAALPHGPYLFAGAGVETSAAWRFGPQQLETLSPAATLTQAPMAFTPDGRYLALGNPEGRIELLSVPGFNPVRSFTRYIEGIVALPDGRRLIAHDRYHAFLFTIEGAPRIQYFSDEINPEDYRIHDMNMERDSREQGP